MGQPHPEWLLTAYGTAEDAASEPLVSTTSIRVGEASKGPGPTPPETSGQGIGPGSTIAPEPPQVNPAEVPSAAPQPAEPLSTPSEAQPHPQIAQSKNKNQGEKGAIHAPLLTALPEYIASKFGSDGPRENYYGLGGLERLIPVGAIERTLLPGQNLAEIEKASPEVFEAAIRAGGASAQESVILQQAMPAIRKALEGSNVSFEELWLAYTESRLRGLRERWADFRDMAEGMSPEQLRDAIFNRSGSEASPFLTALRSVEGRHGMAQDLGQTAIALVEQEDWDNLRKFLEQSFDDAAHRVHTAMDPGWFDDVANAIRTDPKVKEADAIYHRDVEGPMAQNHALNEGIFSTALGPLNRYIPLIPFDRKILNAPGRRLPYRQPKNPANFFATGLSEGYDQSMEAFAKRLAAGIRANDKAALIATMKQSGWFQKMPAAWDGILHGPDGVDYTGVAEEISPGRTIIQNGKTIHTPAQMGIMPVFMNRALKPILAREPMDPNQVARLANWANMLATKGPYELIFHSAGLLGAIYSNTPFLGKSGLDHVLSLPLAKWWTIRAKLLSIDPTAPENLPKLQEMAEAGAIPSKYGKVTYSKEHSRATGATLERFSFGPLLYGPKGIDARGRILMYDIFKAAFPNGTTADLYHFVNQIGNYTPEFQGMIERAIKQIGLGPFATAGMTRLVNAFHAYAGGGPWPQSKGNRLFWLLTASAWMTLALWVASYRYLTGKWPTEDDRAKLFQIPVGGGKGYLDQFRYGPLGKAMWGDGPQVGYLTFGAWDPLSLRGARLLGTPGAFEAHQLHGTLAQQAEAAERDTINSLAHPAMGPALRSLFVGLSGQEPYLTGFHDERGRAGLQKLPAIPNRLKPGFLGGFAPSTEPHERPLLHPGFNAQAGAKAAAAIRELNASLKDLGDSTGFLGSDKGTPGLWWMRTITSLASPGMPDVIGNASNPYGKERMLQREAAAVGR